MKESRTFNVSQFVRDCWLTGMDEWHTLHHIKRLAPSIGDETLAIVSKQYRELDSLNTFAMSDRGISP